MLQNARAQDKLQYLLAWYPHPPPKSIADSFTSCSVVAVVDRWLTEVLQKIFAHNKQLLRKTS